MDHVVLCVLVTNITGTSFAVLMCLVALCYRAPQLFLFKFIDPLVLSTIIRLIKLYSHIPPIFDFAPNVLPIIAVVDLLRFVLSIAFFEADHH